MQLIKFKFDKKPTIAILLNAPFTEQNYKRTGVPYLKENFEVVVLDCNPWVRIGYSSLRFTKYDYPNVITISSANDLEEVISQIKPAYAIDCTGLGALTPFIQKTLRMHGTKLVVPNTGTLPVPNIGLRTKDYLIMAVKNPYRFLLKVIAKLSNYINERRVFEPDVALLAGRKALDSYTTKAKKILWIASNDYYTYKSVQDKLGHQNMCLPFQGKYALYIDDCIPLASDYKLLGLTSPVEPDSYYTILRQTFDRMEHITGLQVVVAAHPNGKEINHYTTLFGGRHVIFDITAELCSQSDLVFSHISTGLSYAVLWKKPIIILTSKSLDKSWQGAAIRERSIQLNCPLLFMESDDYEYREVCKRSGDVSLAAYKNYIDNFIRSDEVSEVAPWQAFTNFVKQNEN